MPRGPGIFSSNMFQCACGLLGSHSDSLASPKRVFGYPQNSAALVQTLVLFRLSESTPFSSCFPILFGLLPSINPVASAICKCTPHKGAHHKFKPFRIISGMVKFLQNNLRARLLVSAIPALAALSLFSAASRSPTNFLGRPVIPPGQRSLGECAKGTHVFDAFSRDLCCPCKS